MYYVYRDYSIAGWVTLAAYLLFAGGSASGRRGCRGWMSWMSLGGVAVVVAALVFGARSFFVVTQDPSLHAYLRIVRQLYCVPVVLYVLGMVWGWQVTHRPGSDQTRGHGFGVVPLPPPSGTEREGR